MSNYKMFTAMITPYDQDLKVNYEKAAEIAKYLIDQDSDGLVVSGTTGESPVLSIEEKIQLFTTIKQAVGSNEEVWGGTGTYSTQASIELSRQAEKAGVDGVLLVNPYYNKPSQEGMYQHFKAIAESLSIPVMLYNMPGRTGINLLPQTVARLAEIENIVAIKESSGSMDQVSELKNLLGDKIDIYAGDDSLTLPMLALGCQGVVSVASHLVGKDIKQMLNAFADGNNELAAHIHSYLFPMFKGLFVATNPVPVKEALNIIGMQVGGFRLPLCSPSEEEIGFIQNLLKKYNL